MLQIPRAGAVLALAVLSAAGCNRNQAAAAPPAPPPTAVALAPAHTTPVDDATEYVGTLKSLRSTAIQPQIDGQIIQIHVKSGDRVQQGAAMMQIDPRRQQAAVLSQEAERAAREANVAFARQQHQRASELFAAGAISRQELEQAETGLRTAEAQSIIATDTSDTTINGSAATTVTPAAADHLVVTYPNTNAGVSNPLTVTATDPYGNTDTNFADTVNFSSSDASAQPGNGLPANGQSLTSGVGSFTATLKTAGTQSITATDSAHSAINGTKTGITVTPLAATHFTTLVHHGSSRSAALTGGFQWAFWVCGAIGLTAVAIPFLLVRRDELEQAVASATAKEATPALSVVD